MSEITIDLASAELRTDLETRLLKIRRTYEIAFNTSTPEYFGVAIARAEMLADELAGDTGVTVACGVLEHLVPQCEARSRDFWLTALGKAIAYLSGAPASYSIDRRMVLEVVTGISRQGTYKIQGDMRTDKYGDICAEDLRAYLQKRLTREDGRDVQANA